MCESAQKRPHISSLLTYCYDLIAIRTIQGWFASSSRHASCAHSRPVQWSWTCGEERSEHAREQSQKRESNSRWERQRAFDPTTMFLEHQPKIAFKSTTQTCQELSDLVMILASKMAHLTLSFWRQNRIKSRFSSKTQAHWHTRLLSLSQDTDFLSFPFSKLRTRTTLFASLWRKNLTTSWCPTSPQSKMSKRSSTHEQMLAPDLESSPRLITLKLSISLKAFSSTLMVLSSSEMSSLTS